MKSLTLTRGGALSGAPTFVRGAAMAAAAALVPATTASAATTGGENTPLHLGGTATAHAASSGSSGIVRTLVGLFIVIAVIYGISWLLRQAKGRQHKSKGNGLSQLASLPLGGGRSVALVRAGQEIVLLGVAEHGVTPIRTYTEEEALALGLDVPEVSDDLQGGPGERPARPAAGVGRAGRVAGRGDSRSPGQSLLDTLRRMTVRS